MEGKVIEGKYVYVERMYYGRYVAKASSETMTGAYYCFDNKNGGYWIGGKHNYRKISRFQYLFLNVKYKFLKHILPKKYKKIEDQSWQ